MPGESANHQPVAIELNPIETRDAVDVDELLRREHPQVHHRDKTLAPGEDLGFLATPSERGEHAIQIRRAKVLKGRWLHGSSLGACDALSPSLLVQIEH
jgi:hypothetical protein